MKKFLFPALLLGGVLAFMGCGDEKTTQPKDTKAKPSINAAAVSQAGAVQKTKAAKSTFQPTGGTSNNGKTVKPGKASSLSSTGKAKYAYLTGSSGLAKRTGRAAVQAEEQLQGWFIDIVNGVDVSTDDASARYVFFFNQEGEYERYDQETGDWVWGYYYVDPEMTYVIFDLDDLDEEYWEITEISETSISLMDGDIDLTLNAYDLEGYDEAEYSETEIETELGTQEWYLAFEMDAEGNIDGNADDTAYSVVFSPDGTVEVVTWVMGYDPETDSLLFTEDEIFTGTWVIADGVLTLDFDGDPHEFNVASIEDGVLVLEDMEDGAVAVFMTEDAWDDEMDDVTAKVAVKNSH